MSGWSTPAGPPPRYDYLDPSGTLFEHYGSRATPENLADREAVIILDLSAWSQLGEVADFVRGFARASPGGRPPRQPGRPRGDVPQGHLGRGHGDAGRPRGPCLGGDRSRPRWRRGSSPRSRWTPAGSATPTPGPATFTTAAELIGAGARIEEIYRLLFERSTLGRLKMLGESLAGLQTDLGGRIVYSTVTREDFERTGAIPQDTEDLVDYTVSVEGVEVGLLFIEQAKGGIKLSARSRKGLDCAKLLAQFGGGGHKAAAGAMLPDPLSEQVPRVLQAVREAIGE